MIEVVVTSDFEGWYDSLAMDEQESVALSVKRLEDYGVSLGFPYSSAINDAKFALRELRFQHQGRPFRVFYAFDPKRQAVLLIGGDKTGRDGFYKEMIPVAERIWREYLSEIVTTRPPGGWGRWGREGLKEWESTRSSTN